MASARAGCQLCRFLWGSLTVNEKKAVCDEQPNEREDIEMNGSLNSVYNFRSSQSSEGRFAFIYFMMIRRDVW